MQLLVLLHLLIVVILASCAFSARCISRAPIECSGASPVALSQRRLLRALHSWESNLTFTRTCVSRTTSTVAEANAGVRPCLLRLSFFLLYTPHKISSCRMKCKWKLKAIGVLLNCCGGLFARFPSVASECCSARFCRAVTRPSPRRRHLSQLATYATTCLNAHISSMVVKQKSSRSHCYGLNSYMKSLVQTLPMEKFAPLMNANEFRDAVIEGCNGDCFLKPTKSNGRMTETQMPTSG